MRRLCRLRGAAEESRRAERVAEYLGIEYRVVDIDDTRFVEDFPRAARLERLSKHDALSYATSMDQIEYSHAVRRALLKRLGDELVAGCSRADAFTRYDHFDDALQVYKIETVLESSLLRHDRLSEPLGIEPVAPFLAEPVVEVSETLPREFRYSGAAKPVLRALCGELLPAEVARWPKMGFEVPWRGWLRQQLRSFREETSRDIRLRSLVSPEYFDAAWNADDPEAEWTLMTLGLLVSDWTEPASSQRSRGGED